MLRTSLPLAALAAGLIALPAHADEASLRKELDALRAEVGSLRSEVKELRAEKAAAPTVGAPATAVAAAPAPLRGRRGRARRFRRSVSACARKSRWRS